MIEIKLLPEADHDIASAALWYEHYRPERRAAFLREYRATVERALRFPHAGSPIVDLKAPFLVRRFWIKEFPYSLMVAIMPTRLVIFALTHEKQDAKHWRRRLAKVLR